MISLSLSCSALKWQSQVPFFAFENRMQSIDLLLPPEPEVVQDGLSRIYDAFNITPKAKCFLGCSIGLQETSSLIQFNVGWDWKYKLYFCALRKFTDNSRHRDHWALYSRCSCPDDNVFFFTREDSANVVWYSQQKSTPISSFCSRHSIFFLQFLSWSVPCKKTKH